METNNRFALLSTQEEEEEEEEEEAEEQQAEEDRHKSIQTKKKTKEISAKPTQRHSWEIPDFIPRSIPISTPLAKIQEDTPSEEKHSFEEKSLEELQSMTSVVTPLPPQHHKFNLHRHKQTSPSTLSKFPRRPPLSLKYGPVRGNSKASTHQI